MQLHTRATWSSRDDRKAAAVWLGLLWLGMICGFGWDFSRYLHENPPAPLIVHIHGAVFTIWLFLLTALVVLVERDQVKLHRTLGWCAAGWACVMLVLGPWAFMASQAVNLNRPPLYDPQAASVVFSNVALFGSLVLCALLLRKNSAAHRRLMILSTVAMADPGFSRITGQMFPNEPQSALVWYFYIYYGDFLLMFLILLWDWRKGRLMKQYVVAAGVVFAVEVVATRLYFWPPWQQLTASWVEAWARFM